MKIRLVCVGKVKESFYRDAVSEYTKRLSRYCKTEIVEVADEMTPEGAGDLLVASILEKEGSRILSKIPDNSYVITLEIKGKKLDSVGLSQMLEKTMNSGNSDITFVIGGSLGLHQSVLKRSDYALSFSDMTFPHQLMRVILWEQVYRAFRIMNHEPYHK